MRVGAILWTGNTGGAEVLTARIVRELVRQGVDARVVFLREARDLKVRLQRWDIGFHEMRLAGLSDVLLHPGRVVRHLEDQGIQGALLSSCGEIALTLKIGAFTGPLVAVEHGTLLQAHDRTLPRRLVHRILRRLSSRFLDTDVAVSAFVHRKLRTFSQAKSTVRIHNGVDLEEYSPVAGPSNRDSVTFGVASRLVRGKGVEDLLTAAAGLRDSCSLALKIAGEGPALPSLQASADRLGLADLTEFIGWTDDTASFWHSCDIGVVPSNRLQEGFGMAALEAMACGAPVIASSCGALPELVTHGGCGLLYPPGNCAQLADHMRAYVESPELRSQHGRSARLRAERCFDMQSCAASYARLFAPAS
jgi:glycosyltransferase involved in cell wall biosynthesis